ncbi:hypothetical protein LTR78_010423 [Recurvomyces mirabilis]|uniref:Erythromycin biosynthesis protein CIII-like C-terminal domain-containing protein n=1 Tax=Recurvomyces mirabilis TaxID=574656 RepID=A0AAE0TPQ8_9PEZI|nr:hypothetical protein LTR78_010423 [Recurvomyces mirabilis]KAK5150501.1 hypothetical protein LTS14_009994 [Recurvomyces mirabilis]
MGSISSPTIDPDVHLVISACPGYGHIRPLRSMAQSLSSVGVPMTFITASHFANSLTHIDGLEFVPLSGKANYTMDRLNDYFLDRANQPKGPFQFLWDLEHIFFGCLPEQHAALQSVITRPELARKKIILISDVSFTGPMPMMLESPGTRRVPLIGVSFFPIAVQSKDTAPFGMGLPSQGEAKNMELNAQATAMLTPVRNVLDRVLEPFNCQKPLPHPNPVDCWFLTPDLLLQLCIPAMETPRSDLRPNVRFIGTFLGANSSRPPPDWFDDFVINSHSNHPLVIVSSGSLPGTDAADLILPTITACSTLPVRLIVCAVSVQKPASFDLPENCRWAEWIPFELLLPHVNLVVNNGGYSAISQAFAEGIPMVVAGVTEDKAEATARAAATGAAVNLATQTPGAEQIREAVEKVLGERRYKERAMELKEDFARCDAVGSMVQAINEMAEKFYGGGSD